MKSLLFSAIALSCLAALSARGLGFTTLHSFSVYTNGATPEGTLVLAGDGNFYGTTEAGGTNGGLGTVFRLTTSGVLTTLHTFSGSDGANPLGALAIGKDGALYGTTENGGSASNGIVFRMTTNGIFSVFADLGAGANGAYPIAGLLLASDGNFYGTASGGGANAFGTVFRVSTGGVLTGLYSFGSILDSSGNPLDGANPDAALIQASDGNLYGSTSSGGDANSDGTLFRFSLSGTLTTLYTFSGTDGSDPEGALVQASDGNLYGTTAVGGAYGYGTVFQFTTNGALASLYSFGTISDGSGDPLDGSNPYAALVQGADGQLYGTTGYGGANDANNGGDGAIFKITTGGALTDLRSLAVAPDPNGAFPVAGLALRNGVFYGLAASGGTNSNGTAFRITTTGTFTLLYTFPGTDDGANPSAAMIQGRDGNFYGTTEAGGYSGNGTIFKVSSSGAFKALAQFEGTNGSGAEGKLAQTPDGTLYGTTTGGGTYNAGNVYALPANGTVTNVYSFSGGSDGAGPEAGLFLAPDGYFYGTASYGGDVNGDGTIFQISTSGVFNVVVTFDGSTGSQPWAGLTLGADGNYYGTTSGDGSSSFGTVFQLMTNGTFNNLYSFSGGADGSTPEADLTLGTNGNFYGTTVEGGNSGDGTIFEITPGGSLTTLYSFSGPDGTFPSSTLVLAPDGNFYGTTINGGTNDNGVVFQISHAGAFAVVHLFTGLAEGANPDCGLTLGSDGNLYGIAEFGGLGGQGTVFQVSLNSAPVFQKIARSGGNTILTWTAVAGRDYQVQARGNLTQGTWTNLGAPIAATGSVASASFPVSSIPKQFYRVALLP